MENLLVFLKRYGYWVVFLLLEVLAFGIFLSFNHRQGAAFFTSVNELSARVNGVYAEAVAFVNLRTANRELTAENARLRILLGLSDDDGETNGESFAVGDSGRVGPYFSVLPARVVSQTIHRRENYIVINRGSRDGVTEGMGVVSSGGVVGTTFLVEPHYSMLLPIINSRSSLSCTFKDKNYFGYLGWDGGDVRVAYLTDVPRYANIEKGDTVLTSGYSAMFPRGLYVGRVLKITDADDGLSLKVYVQQGTDFARLSNVCILQQSDRTERDSLQRRLDKYWGAE